MHLFCLSYAGGSANIYNKWKQKSAFVQVDPIELAGHGSRMREQLCSDFDAIVEDVYTKICDKLQEAQIQQYAIYGHSMGCWIAFEVAKKLFANPTVSDPLRLFFSGNCVPRCRNYDVDPDAMSDRNFRKMIIHYGGIPDSVLKHPEILDFYMPIIKSDYYALASYQREEESFQFNCDVSVMNGIKDDFNEEEMLEWKDYAGKRFKIRNFNDGHFFINSMNQEVFTSVCSDLKESVLRANQYA